MEDAVEAIKILSQEIKRAVHNYLAKASFDKTVAGYITGISDNKYQVEIKGAVYTVPSSIDIQFSAGDSVWVTIPQNDWDNMYIAGRRN